MFDVVSTNAERLAAVFLDLLDAHIERRIVAAIAELVPSTNSAPEWLTLEQAGNRLGCSVDAVRMRVKRGRLVARHQGRRVYVSRQSVDGLS
jgi:excisionase family DNA binding protein